jgi:DNA-binding FadR family transcriptional regulator
VTLRILNVQERSMSPNARATTLNRHSLSATAAGLSPEGRSQKLAETIAEKIELRIIDQGWPVGDVIGSESELLADYGVSRAVLREAIRLLEHHRVAEMRRGPGGGLVVTDPDPAAVTRAAAVYLRYRNVDAEQLFHARIALELAAVRSAAQRIDEAGIAKLRAVLEHETTFVDGVADATVHDFHIVVAELSGNPALHLFVDVLTKLSAAGFMGAAALFDKTAARRRSTPTELGEVHAVHQAIAEAIIAGDVALAQHRTQRHLDAMCAMLHA